MLVIATNTIYRIKRGGLENVPEKGGALLVCNHLSLLDGLFIMVCIDRPVRFIVEASYYNNRLFLVHEDHRRDSNIHGRGP